MFAKILIFILTKEHFGIFLRMNEDYLVRHVTSSCIEILPKSFPIQKKHSYIGVSFGLLNLVPRLLLPLPIAPFLSLYFKT
jgi:hypothetical protein